MLSIDEINARKDSGWTLVTTPLTPFPVWERVMDMLGTENHVVISTEVGVRNDDVPICGGILLLSPEGKKRLLARLATLERGG